MRLFLILLTLITPITSLIEETNKLWKKPSGPQYYRPGWAGIVTIEIENKRINSVEGIIIPLSTGDRPGAPNPYNNCYYNSSCPEHHCIKEGYNRGHIMGLGNGGPDLRENIVPQWEKWQGAGGVWYDFEVYINEKTFDLYRWDKKPHPEDLCMNKTQKNCTEEPNKKVYWKINLIYEDDCEPVRYEGFIFFGEKKYTFDFINNGTKKIVLEPYKEPDNKDDNLLPWIFVFIIFTILWGCFFYHRKRLFQNHLNETEFEQLQDN
jgi:hypothetical protein